jgi:hypothetical protein
MRDQQAQPNEQYFALVLKDSPQCPQTKVSFRLVIVMNNTLEPQGPVAIDDQTGFKVPLRHLKRQWDGARVVNPDKRNPQDTIRARPERNTVENPRPEPADVFLATNILLEDGLTPLIGEDGSAIMTEGPLNGAGL